MPGDVMFWFLFTCLACFFLGVLSCSLIYRLICKIRVILLIRGSNKKKVKRDADS